MPEQALGPELRRQPGRAQELEPVLVLVLEPVLVPQPGLLQPGPERGWPAEEAGWPSTIPALRLRRKRSEEVAGLPALKRPEQERPVRRHLLAQPKLRPRSS